MMRARLVRRTATIKLASVATVAQGVASLSTLVVGLIVARELGAVALGQFSFLLIVLTLFVAIQSAWVGDALAVLQSEPYSHGGISTTQWLHMLAGLTLAPLVAMFGAHVGWDVAVLFGLATASWQLREYGRRALIARLAFGRQIVADLSYLVLSSAVLAALVLADRLTSTTVWLAVSLGAGASAAVGLFLLPRGRRLLLPRRTDWPAVSSVADFGFWRAAQIGTGYVAQVGFRYAVIVSGSFAVLGTVEAARIIVAPLVILYASLTNVLLPVFSRRKTAIRARTLAVGAGVLVAASGVYGALVLAMSHELANLLYGGSIVPPASAILGWIAVAASVALAAPYTVYVLVNKGSRTVFNSKVIGSAVGLAAATGLCVAGEPLIAPVGLALGNVLSAGMIIRSSIDCSQPNTPSVQPLDGLARSPDSA